MQLSDQLRILEAAQGDQAQLALATVDLAYPTLSDAEREALKDALQAAAVPHWCDTSILAALLDIPRLASESRLERLRSLTVVEPFPARGTAALNVHETARLALRRRLAETDLERFRSLSVQATDYFATDLSPAGRIEWIYHLLISDPERGAAKLEMLTRDWSGRAPPEDRYALAAALGELDDARLVQGRSQAWVLLTIAWTRVFRGETAQLMDTAAEALRLAKETSDEPAQADAHCLFGVVFEAQGQLAAAQAAFGEDLAISRRLAEQDPSNAGWQRDLAVVGVRLARIEAAANKVNAALRLYEEALGIFTTLLERAPDHAQWAQEHTIVEAELARLRSQIE